MAVYAIGDVQGCDAELARLLDKLNPLPGRDEIWFVGDLVNRGPNSLGVLRRVRALGRTAVVVLGNHDLHLLALAQASGVAVAGHNLDDVLGASDADELLDWLRKRPLAHYRPDLNTLMVHAGVPPQWDPLQTVKLAREVEAALRGRDSGKFLVSMYGQRPDTWSADLKGAERLRFITNSLTRIRYCHADGRLDFRNKGAPADAPAGLLPWFEMKKRATDSVRVVFGHWSTLGRLQRKNLIGLDTGCVWGGQLTAARLDGPTHFITVNSKTYRKP